MMEARLLASPGDPTVRTHSKKRIIKAPLVQTRGTVLKASKLLGVSRGALRYKLAKHKIDPSALVKRVLVPTT